MDIKTLIVIMTIAVALVSSADLSVTTSNTATSPVESGSEATGLYNRSKRQFGYGGFGGGYSGSSATAGASSFGGGGFPGGFGGPNAFASANSGSTSFGK